MKGMYDRSCPEVYPMVKGCSHEGYLTVNALAVNCLSRYLLRDPTTAWRKIDHPWYCLGAECSDVTSGHHWKRPVDVVGVEQVQSYPSVSRGVSQNKVQTCPISR